MSVIANLKADLIALGIHDHLEAACLTYLACTTSQRQKKPTPLLFRFRENGASRKSPTDEAQLCASREL